MGPSRYSILFSLLVISILAVNSVSVNAQEWLNDMFKSDASISERSIFDIQKRAREHFKYEEQEYYSRYFKIEDYPELEYKNIRQFISYKRWEEYWLRHIDENGNPVPAEIEYNEFLKFKDRQTKGPDANWTNINRTAGLGGYWGMGRIREIAFHPTEPNTIWLGADQGGIWKSEDNGNTYTPIGDGLPFLRVSSICVDYTNPDIIYMAGGGIGTNYWQRAIGVYKTTDGGLNWLPTGFTSELADNKYIRRLAINPVDPGVLIVTTKEATYRTTDAGENWSLVNNGEAWDIIFHPDGNTVFIGKGGSIMISEDGGFTWNSIFNSGESGTFKHFSISPLNDNKLAAQLEGPDITSVFVSTDKGQTWEKKSTVTEDTGGTIGFSAQDENTLYRGWTKIFKSDDLGANWTQKTNWYSTPNLPEIHADHFRIEMNPHKPDTLYFCNDGGLYIFDEANSIWSEKSEGLIISQYYSLSSSQSDPSVLLCGSQDNGGWYRRSDGQWRTTNGGDGMHTWQDPINVSYGYSSYPGGKIYRTTNAWATYASLFDNISPAPSDGDWNSRFVIDPNNKDRIVTGCFKEVYESTDKGESWKVISTNMSSGSNMHAIAMPEGNSQYIYTSSGSIFNYTFNGGQDWSSSSLGGGGTIQDICVSDYDPKLLWAVTSGYTNGSKVFKSVDGGKNWENITGSLPNIPALSIIHRKGTTESLYVGMTYGIYYRDKNMDDWEFFGHGIPNTEIRDLDIQYSENKIRCATYGRGLFEADLHTLVGEIPIANFVTDKSIVCAEESIQFLNSSEGANNYIWYFGDGASSTLENPEHYYTRPGTYRVRLIALNDDFTSTFTIETDLWVKPNINPVYLGPKNREIGEGTYSRGDKVGLLFNVHSPSRLLSFTVYSTTKGSRSFEILDNNGNLINSVRVNVDYGENRVYVNTDLPTGNDFVLRVNNTDGLYLNYSGVSFPYGEDSQVSITGNTEYSKDRYYYFYDWRVQYLTCDLNQLPAIQPGDNIASERIIVYPNPVRETIKILIKGFDQDEDLSLRIISMDGTLVYNRNIEKSRDMELDISSLGNYAGSLLVEVRGKSFNAVKQILRIME